MVSGKNIFDKWQYFKIAFLKTFYILLLCSAEHNQQKVNTCWNWKIKICDTNLKVLTLVCSKKVRVTILVGFFFCFSKIIKCSWSWPDFATLSVWFFLKYMYLYLYIWVQIWLKMLVALLVRYGTQFTCFVQNRHWDRLSRCHPVTTKIVSIGTPCPLKK